MSGVKIHETDGSIIDTLIGGATMDNITTFLARQPKMIRYFKEYLRNEQMSSHIAQGKTYVEAQDEIADLRRKLGENMKECADKSREAVLPLLLEHLWSGMWEKMRTEVTL